MLENGATDTFLSGLRLLPQVQAQDAQAFTVAFRQDFWALSDDARSDVRDAMAEMLRTLVGEGAHAWKVDVIYHLVARAYDGDAVWHALGTLLSRCSAPLLRRLLDEYPRKLSRYTLEEMDRSIHQRLSPAPKNVFETMFAASPAERPALMALREQVYQLRLQRYIRSQGPQLGASFEAEKATLDTKLVGAGFRPHVSEAIQTAHEAVQAPANSFSFKTSMDLTRSAYEHLLSELAARAKVQVPEEATGGMILERLRKDGRLDEREHQLGRWLYKFVSDRGTHTLTSQVEEARLCLFMVMQYSQYLLERLRKTQPQ